MWFTLFFLLANCVGLTALFATLVLWSRETGDSSRRLISPWGLGALCVLTAGAGLVVGAHDEAVAHGLVPGTTTPSADGLATRWDFLASSSAVVLGACLALLAVGAALLVFGTPANAPQAPPRKGVFVGSVALALIIALAELSALQAYNQRRASHQPEASHQPDESNPPKTETRFPGLPSRKLDTAGTRPHTDYKAAYQFRPKTEHYFTSRHPLIWEQALETYKGKPDIHYLEVGVFEGQSVLWMLENVLTHPTARLTGIDPFIDDYVYSPQPYKEVFFSNLELSGSESKATIIEGFSQIELRRLPLESFDIIYIDGSHDEPDVLEDAILSWRLLKEGGMLILDDYLMETHEKPQAAIDAFFAFFGDKFEVVHVDWQVILKKKPEE
jgi:hypothetical protein